MSQIIIIDSAESLADQIIKAVHERNIDSVKAAILACLHPIEVPSDAEELAQRAIETVDSEMLALGEEIDTVFGPTQPPQIQQEVAIPYLAALIADFGKRIKKADLAELWHMANKHGYENGDENKDIETWATKYGYRAE